MDKPDNLNELLAQCERELDQANQALSDLVDVEVIDDLDAFNAEVDYLSEKLNRLTREFESLIQFL